MNGRQNLHNRNKDGNQNLQCSVAKTAHKYYITVCIYVLTENTANFTLSFLSFWFKYDAILASKMSLMVIIPILI